VPRAWRLCRRRYATSAFDGEGARLSGGRWNQAGIPVVYVSATVSLAALEAFVHMDPDEAPEDLVVIPVGIPDDLALTVIGVRGLPRNWRSTPAPPSLQRIGSEWARDGKTAVLSVPSAVVPQERNYLLNPRHPEFSRIETGKPELFHLDPRLRK